MLKAILGEQYRHADETLYHKVRNRVGDYIEKSTGVQTIVQMKALVDMVREFGLVPEDHILDEYGYKQLFNDALMKMVNARIEKFKKGSLDINELTIKGSVSFLEKLSEKGIKLYLASGTDEQDVINEATILGYAHLFQGRIHGSVGDVSKYSKKMVVEKIIADNNLKGPELIVFGDGPVEIRQTRKVAGLAIGIASDEIRRYGMDLEKRPRLVKAGAHVIIPDFAEPEKLIEQIFS